MHLALSRDEREMLAILLDSQAAIQAIVNMSRGAPPRTGIKAEIKAALTENQVRDVKVVWVRDHIGIEGSEKADRQAAFESILGQIRGSPRTVTEGGIRTEMEQWWIGNKDALPDKYKANYLDEVKAGDFKSFKSEVEDITGHIPLLLDKSIVERKINLSAPNFEQDFNQVQDFMLTIEKNYKRFWDM
ncbi:hypothetical protein BGX38DRAFT_1268461 [Terfezia claveryi]|nr:hypothetical protein BGX38DRAFT_1268461 [Terfezia claveryi]